jgi:hypothetical protein
MVGRISSPRFVGRVAELEALEELLRHAASGSGGAMLVAGEAGIGKSRLVVELGTRARAAGTLVLVGECVELAEGELAFSPIIAALRGVMADAAALEGLGGPLRSALAALWPVPGAAESSALAGRRSPKPAATQTAPTSSARPCLSYATEGSRARSACKRGTHEDLSGRRGRRAVCESAARPSSANAAEHAQEGPSKTQSTAAVPIGTGRRHQSSPRRPRSRHWGSSPLGAQQPPTTLPRATDDGLKHVCARDHVRFVVGVRHDGLLADPSLSRTVCGRRACRTSRWRRLAAGRRCLVRQTPH